MSDLPRCWATAASITRDGLMGHRVVCPARVALDATILLRTLRECQAFSLRSLHEEDEWQEGEGHPTNEPEQIDERLHLCLTGNPKRDHFYGAWRGQLCPEPAR